MFLGGNNVGDVPANAHSVPLKQLPPDRRPQYVAYPPPDAPEVAKYTSKCCTQRAWARGDQNVVFIGQVPRLLPLQYIPWALDLLLEEYGTRWVLQTQPNGCAKAWVDDPAHCRTLIDRSKHMLFDVCGVWVARTRAQVEAMMAYQAGLQTGGPLDGRVPKHGMIAEGLRPPQSVTARQQLQQQPQYGVMGISPSEDPTRRAPAYGAPSQFSSHQSRPAYEGTVPYRPEPILERHGAPGTNPNAKHFSPTTSNYDALAREESSGPRAIGEDPIAGYQAPVTGYQ